jgi:hypothetical protein
MCRILVQPWDLPFFSAESVICVIDLEKAGERAANNCAKAAAGVQEQYDYAPMNRA